MAGERRYTADQIASLKQLPVIVENFCDEEAGIVFLSENLQRLYLCFKEEVNFLAQLNEKRTQEGFGGDSDLGDLFTNLELILLNSQSLLLSRISLRG